MHISARIIHDARASKLRRLVLIGALFQVCGFDSSPTREFMNLQKLSPLQEYRLKHQTRRLSS
jgi:hypothetical protein